MKVTKDSITKILLNKKEVTLLQNIIGFQGAHMVGELRKVHDKTYVKESGTFIMELNSKLNSVL